MCLGWLRSDSMGTEWYIIVSDLINTKKEGKPPSIIAGGGVVLFWFVFKDEIKT